MIDFNGVRKSFGGQDVLVDASFRVNVGERVGIVGPNGSGKTTVFRLITGAAQADAGDVAVPRQLRIGYLPQILGQVDESRPLLDFVSDAVPDLARMRREIRELERRLATEGTDGSGLLERLGELQSRFEAGGGYELKTRAESALSGLGFEVDRFPRPLAELSGGWQMRAALARSLVGDPDVLLLDEPSNYLDLPAVEWLQRHLRSFEGTLLLISHDRFLLRCLTTVTLEINAGEATRYSCGYDGYVKAREERRERLSAARRNQQRRRDQTERLIARFRAKASKASMVQSRIKMLEKMETVVLPQELQFQGEIRLPAPPPCGIEVLRLDDAGLSYDGERWVQRHVELRLMRGERLTLVGYNGTGKTTLLRAIAGVLPLREGRRALGHGVSIGYQAQEFAEVLPPRATAYEIVSAVAPASSTAGQVRDLLGSFGFSGANVDKPSEVLSGGEKIRLVFARLFADPPNLLILDEPTTHLDLATREGLQEALKDYQGTVCLVSHDVDFVRAVATGILAVGANGVTRYHGGYDYYQEKLAAVAETPAAAEPVAERQDERRERRRERAAARQAFAGERRRLNREVAEAEAALTALETERESLAGQFGEPGATLDFAAVNRRLGEIEDELAAATAAWEHAATALEALEQRYERIHD